MSKELFINFMREKGVEPTSKDIDKFIFMATSLVSGTLEWNDPETPPEDYDNVLLQLDGRIIAGGYMICGEWVPTSTYTDEDVVVEFCMPVTGWMAIPDVLK